MHQSDIHGPPWLGAAAGGSFVAAGLAMAVGESSPWASGLLVILILAGFAAIGHWIAFGAGERACSGTASFLGSAMGWDAGDMECRIAFGLGAVILDAILFLALASLLQKVLGGPPRLAWLVKAARGVVLLSLAPLLLLLAMLALLRGGFDAMRTRVTTGAWPSIRKAVSGWRAKRPPAGNS